MMGYRSYETAYRKGGKDVWPGCGRVGRCMPCGWIHNYEYRQHVNGPMVNDFRCAFNHRAGCPRPKPEPEHDLTRQRRCRRCGTRCLETP